MIRNFKIGISPCPNDTFIFSGIYDKNVSYPDFSFEFILEDIEQLNKRALAGHLDIIKISYAHLFNLKGHYEFLRSGGAMGYGVGPLLLSKSGMTKKISECLVAIPGEHTTANFLLRYLFPDIQRKIILPFYAIENAVLNGEADLGLVIHESRFTYHKKGLHRLYDLGQLWEQETGLPIPLGGIAIKSDFDPEIKKMVNQLVSRSIKYAQQHPVYSEFIVHHAQEMENDVIQSHIDLYVNEFSLDIGKEGQRAVNKMRDILAPEFTHPLFIE